MKKILNLIWLLASIMPAFSQNVEHFFGSSDGTESIDLRLGTKTSGGSSFQIFSNDTGGSNYLRWHGTRWGTGFSWSRLSSSGTKTIGTLYGGSSASYFQLYHGNSQAIGVQLNTNGNSYFNGGNVGIGTYSPSEKLDVNGNARFSGSATIAGNQIRFSESRGFDYDVDLDAILYNGYNNGQVAMLSDRDGNAWFNGKLGIGITSPSEKLEVNGTIRSKEVRVEATGWPDYVFEATYNLRTLEETEAYIKANKHLPEVPAAEEMEANGVQLGEMNMLLLKKIEELTLYQIELLKKIDEQNRRIEKLENQ